MEFSEIVGDEDGKSSDWHTSDMPDDVKNALSLAFLDGFHNEVHRLHEELQQEWEEAENDDLPMEFSFGGVGLKTYELHSLTVEGVIESVTRRRRMLELCLRAPASCKRRLLSTSSSM